MARSRNIKPGFFKNEDLVECGFATRLLFAGLWTIADRDGRLEDRPKKIKMDVFPADDVDINAMLTELERYSFVSRYEINGARYIQIANWSKHQNPHHTEKASDIPGPNGEITVKAPLKPKGSPKQDGGNLADSLIPDSLIPDSLRSVAIATGGKPSIATERADIWRSMKALFADRGVDEKAAGAFLSKLVTKHKDPVALEAMRSAIANPPGGELRAWLEASCQQIAGRQLKPRGGVLLTDEQRESANAESTAKAAALLGFDTPETINA